MIYLESGKNPTDIIQQLQERIKELTCLYRIAEIANNVSLSMKEVLSQICEVIPPAMQYPDIACCRLIVDDNRYYSSGYEQSSVTLQAEIKVNYQVRGSVEIFYQTMPAYSIPLQFLPEEEKLLYTVAQQIAMIVEQKTIEAANVKLQEQLHHADRLATIGQLAAGIAHEINEPPGTILGFAQLVQSGYELPEAASQDLKMEHKERILIVDDATDTLEMLRRKLSGQGFDVYTASDVPKAIELLANIPIELVLTDYEMPRISGLDLIRHIRDHYPLLKVIMITGFPTIEGAVEALKVGAEEYLTKPFTDEELFKAVDAAILKIHNQKLALKTTAAETNPYGIIGRSKAMQKVYQGICKSCASNATVLIQGESGTGKELVARVIHYHSKRAKAPFVPVNCGAIPETMIESELFGYLKGAFTGASETQAGYFITADGGSIFLDEICETPLSMQVKLLRFLQDKQVYMVGSKSPRLVDVRIIAATNKDIQNLVSQGLFREDLFYQLNVLPILLPPLRERREDIAPLTYFYLGKSARENARPAPAINDEVLETLRNYHWPGNVRELENLVYRLVLTSDDGMIDKSDLPDYMKLCLPQVRSLNRTLEEVKQDHIHAVLQACGGNKSQAAKILGIDRKTLHNRLKLSGQ